MDVKSTNPGFLETTLALARHPLQAADEVRPALMHPGETLAVFLAREGVQGSGWVVSVGGRDVPAAWWPRVRVKHGQVIEARAVVRKSVLKIVALVALMYFTMGMGGIAAGSFMGMTGFAGFAAAAATYMVGTAVINKVLGPPKQRGPDPQAAENPTYALAGGRNQARPYSALALVLGETKMVPDYASQSFTWFEGDEQFLICTFHAGLNCASVQQIKVGATDISSYQNVTVWRAGFAEGNDVGNAVLRTSVDSIAGAALENTATDGSFGAYVVRTSSPGTVLLAVDIEGSLTLVNDKGQQQQEGCHIDQEYRLLPGGAWAPLVGNTSVYLLTHTGTKPLRLTLKREVPAGQYEVRMRRRSGPSSDAGSVRQIAWTVLKSYQPDNADYGGQPRVQIEIKASGQLNGALDEVNWIARSAAVPIWNGVAWVVATQPGATGISNPGAIILALLRGAYRASDGRRLWGAGLPDTRIDLESLKGFMVRCAQKGYRFDAVIQDTMSLGDLLEAVAYAGLGSISRHTGKVGVIWMAEDQPIEGVVNMGAMKAKTFGVEYNLGATADELQFEYFDPTNNWTWQPVRVKAPGVVTPQRSARSNLLGITQGDHAAALARFAMGQNVYGRKTVSFELDLEHLTYRRYSLLSISHDLTQWGYGGRVLGITAGGGGFVVQLDAAVPVDPPPGGARYLGLRLAGEAQMRVFSVAQVGADGMSLQASGAWPAGVAMPGMAGDAAHDALWMFDFKATPGNKMRVVGVTPSANLKGAKLTLVPEGPEFWNYVLNGEYVPAPNNSLLSRQLPVASRLVVTEERTRQGDGWYTTITVTFDVSGNYDHAQIWGAVGNAALTLQTQTNGLRANWRATPGDSWTIEVRPFDALGRMGTIASTVHSVDVPGVTGVQGLTLSVEAAGVIAKWSVPAAIEGIGWASTELRQGDTWAAGAKLFTGRVTSHNLGWLHWGNLTVWAVHRDSSGNVSAPVSASLMIETPAQPTLTAIADMSVIKLAWTDSKTTQPVSHYLIRKGAAWDVATSLGKIDGLSITLLDILPGIYKFWAVAVDMGGNESSPGWVSVTVASPISAAMAILNAGLTDSHNAINDLGEEVGALAAKIEAPDIGLRALESERSMLALALQQANEAYAALDLSTLLQTAKTNQVLRDAGIVVDPATGQIHITGLDQTATRVSQVKADFDAVASTVVLSAQRITQLQTDLINAQLDPTGAAVVAGVVVQINQVQASLDAANAQIALRATSAVVGDHYLQLQTAVNTLSSQGQELLAVAQNINALQNDIAGANSRLQVLENSATSTVELVAARFSRLGDQGLAEVQDANFIAALLKGSVDKESAAKQLAYAKTELTASVDKLGEASAQQYTLLISQVGQVQAAVDAEASTRATALGAEATARQTLAIKQQTDTDTLSAGLTNEASLRTTAVSAEATQRQALAVKQQNDHNTVAAAVQTESAARTTETQATASQLTQIQASFNSQVAAISQRLAVVVDANGQVVAAYTLALNANGHIVGVRLDNNGTVGNYVVQADKFAFFIPGSSVAIPLFVAGLVQGVNTFGINGQLMVDGTIYARALAVDRLSAITANLGTVTAGTLNMDSDGAGGWASIQSFNKWWDGVNGWAMARHPDGRTFVSFIAGACRLRLSSWNDCELAFPGFRATQNGVEISQLKVIDTLQLNDYAVTVPVGADGYGQIPTLTVTMTQPGAIFVTVMANAIAGNGSEASLYLSAACNGVAGREVGVSMGGGYSGSATAFSKFDVGVGNHVVGGFWRIADGSRTLGSTSTFAIGVKR